MKSYFTNKTWFTGSFLIILALIYVLFEISVDETEFNDSDRYEIAHESVYEAKRSFSKFEKDFLEESQALQNLIKEQLEEKGELELAATTLEKDFDFWGVSLFRDHQLLLWHEFGPREFVPDTTLDELSGFIEVQQRNNVTFLNYRSSLIVQKNDSTRRYQLVTRKKLQQENVLPIGDSSEQSLDKLLQTPPDYPVHFSFFDSPPVNPLASIKISTHHKDSVGVIFALNEDYAEFEAAKENQTYIYRAAFYVLLISIFMIFLVLVSKWLTSWQSLLLKIFAILLAWVFFSSADYGTGWIQLLGDPTQFDFNSYIPLFKYSLHAVFVSMLTAICYKAFSSEDYHIKLPGTLLSFIVFTSGFLSALLVYFFLSKTYSLFFLSNIPILDLGIFPAASSLLFYFFAGLFSISVTILVITISRYLLSMDIKSFSLYLTLLGCGFFGGVLMLKVFGTTPNSMQLMVSSLLYFSVILAFLWSDRKTFSSFGTASVFRLFLILSFFVVSFTYFIAYKGYSERLNNQLEQASQQFIGEEESQADQIIRNLLTDLENNISGINAQDLLQKPELAENIFTQNTRDIISNRWESFSISTQLINNEGDIISEYSSNLDSPAWTKAFNMLSIVVPFEMEQISVNNLIPIVRQRPLNESNSNYSTFRRGWIPLYTKGDNPERIGWILSSVYRERPQYNKPLRAVLAIEESSDRNASISITEYINGTAARRSILGSPIDLPGYSKIPETLNQQILNDSTFYRTVELADQSIREYFVVNSEQQIIRSATKQPTTENHLFALIRFFFSVMIMGFLVLWPISRIKKFTILANNKRFRDRLTDQFIFASMVCLMVLIGATYFAINHQTEKSIQYQLLDKLSTLTEAITTYELENTEINSQPPLAQFTSTLEADATLYKKNAVYTSTAEQIYSQHLLPRLLPWEVHKSIFERGNNQVTRRIRFGNQDLLVGYQPWLDGNGDISGIVAIPTFLDAPKFNERLLATTSYLLVFYVLIFGLFILGAALISRRLTEPLESLREGLRKISGGNLETTLPVQSKDEIGSLTSAYNTMVKQLKELQKELAKAEREAAWKEMAQQVAHEIKNPLTPMKLNLQHLERQLNVSDEDFIEMKPKIEKIASNMIEQIDSLNKIASDFSKFSQPTNQPFKSIEIHEILHSVKELYSTEEKLTVKTVFDSTNLTVRGVEDELRRAFINLIKNAYEAMPNGGVITLKTELNTKKNTVIISVKDNGSGISPEDQDKIFVPNFSTKSSGTGLGLAITKKIINEHNGQILFRSKPKRGTTFTITLPAYFN